LRTLLALATAFLLSSCASSHIITGKPRPPIDPAQVKLYSTAPAKYDEIAIIEASSKSSWSITDQGKIDVVIERLKEEAAKLGANGVLLQMTGSESAGGVMTGFASGSNPTVGTGIYASAMHKVGRALAIHVER
jgi:hypothetical protein